MTGMATLEQIQRMTKLELHIHLEGTFDPETVCLLAEMQGISLPRPRQHLFDFSGLSDFLDLLDWICSLVQNRETAQQIAYRHAKYAQEQGILYTEIIVNPSHWKNIRTGELLTGVLEGFDQAGADGLPDCRLLVSLRREQDTASARRTIEWILSHRHPRLVGGFRRRKRGLLAGLQPEICAITGESGGGRAGHCRPCRRVLWAGRSSGSS